MPEYDVEQVDEQHPAEKRIADRELRALKAENALLKSGLDLNDKQRSALLKAVEDPTPENLKAEAEALGFVKPDTPEQTPEDDAVLAAEERISAIAADHAPPPPPMAPILAAREKVMQAASRDVYPGSPLYQETLAAIQAAGGQFVNIEHTGQLTPTS